MQTATMEPRMTHPAMAIPDAMKALHRLSKAAKEAGLPEQTGYLVHLRASQINGCSYCVEMHSRELKDAGCSDDRIYAVAAWREAPYFSDAERAALALAEATTRLADRPDPVPDEVWDEATIHYDEQQLAALMLEIASINVWNRFNVATRQMAGSAPAQPGA
jgi:AhpD family alkylhydroperoxidase